MECVLNDDAHITNRWKVLNAMEDPRDPEVQLWISEQRQTVIRSLNHPAESDMPVLIDIARTHGGLNLLETS